MTVPSFLNELRALPPNEGKQIHREVPLRKMRNHRTTESDDAGVERRPPTRGFH